MLLSFFSIHFHPTGKNERTKVRRASPTSDLNHKIYYGRNFTDFRYKLECLSLASLSSLV
jgi:hypothetical protein